MPDDDVDGEIGLITLSLSLMIVIDSTELKNAVKSVLKRSS